MATFLRPFCRRWANRLGLSLGLLALLNTAAYAQLSTYSFTQSTMSPAYTTLTGGTQLSAAYNIAGLQFNGAATVNYGSYSSSAAEGFPIGFNFKFGSQTYDRFAINASGWISLGKSSDGASAVTAFFPNAGNDSPLSNTGTGPTNVIAGFTADLATGTGSSLRYLVTGTAPNRSLVVQWTACGIYGTSTAPGYYPSTNSFQIVLDETTNAIRFRYGMIDNDRVGGTYGSGQVGLRGATTSDFVARTNIDASGNWNSWLQSTAATYNSQYMISSNLVYSKGIQYTYTPPACGSPTNAAISNLTATSASLSFTPSSYGGSYTVQLTPAGGTATTVTTTATSSPVALTNLTPGTVYTATVSATCTTAGLSTTSAYFTTPITNDECSTAAVLPVNATCAYTVVNTTGGTASANVPATTCGSYNSADAWYSLTVPASGGVLLTTSAYAGSAVTSTYIGVYAGSCGSLTAVGCNTSNNQFVSTAVTGRTPGSTLWVRVRSNTLNINQPVNGRFNLCAVPTIANDECATAAPLPVSSTCTNTLVNTALATISTLNTPRGSCFTLNDPDAWYSVTVPASGAINIATSAVSGSSVTGAYLYVYYGGCGNPVLVGCQSNSGFAAVSVRNQTPGDVLLVRVQAPNSQAGPFNICATTTPDNDEPSRAVALPFGTACTTLTGNNYNATTTIPNGYTNGSTCSGNTAPRDVWYSFRTNAAGTGPQTVRIIVTGGAAGQVRVFSATSGNGPFTPVDCAVGLGNNTAAPPLRMTNLSPNALYYVAVSDRSANDATGTFTICAQDQTTLAARSALAGGEVRVYPNPASQRFTLSLPPLGTVRSASVQVVNALGQVVLTQAIATGTAGTEAAVDVAGLATGLYSVQVRAGAEQATVRLAVE